MLQAGASVNFYMFYGGTNFGFTAGTHRSGIGNFKVYTTSYDYDAPITEAGDITPKYHLIRDVIKDFLPLPNVSVPINEPKMQPTPIQLHPKTALLSSAARTTFGSEMISSQYPITFEQMNQFAGFVLYETMLPEDMADPSILRVLVLHDRAIVCVDNVSKMALFSLQMMNSIEFRYFSLQNFVGILSRETLADQLSISAGFGRVLQILVENQGRNNFELHENKFKGIVGNVVLNGRILENWNITGFPFDSVDSNLNASLVHNEQDAALLNKTMNRPTDSLINGPVIFETTFDLNEIELYDTYIDPSGWGKVECPFFPIDIK